MRSTKHFFLLLLALALSIPTYGQETPPGHGDVWKNVQSYWSLWAQRDLDGYLEYYHAGYSGWSDNDDMHKGKNAIEKWYRHSFSTTKVILYDINPIDIKIHDDVAVVHYYYSILEKNTKDGTERISKGRKTDFLKWQLDKWLILASHGGKIYGG